MNVFDVVVALVATAAVAAGYRYGFLNRALSWVGLVAGLVIGGLFVDDVANALADSTPRTRLLGSLAFLFLTAVLGQALGILLSIALRRSLTDRGFLSVGDRVAGAVAGLLAVLVAVWLLIPAFSNNRGWPARAVRGSAIARAVDDLGPSQPGSIAALGRLVGDAGPQVFESLSSPDEAGPPPTTTLAPDVAARVFPAVVKIEGRACDQIQQGSGYVAADDFIVTNAHVVAGESDTSVLTPDGRELDATVVSFDPDRDLAVLRARGLDIAPLERADPVLDSTGAVIGYPGGGSEHEAPARIVQEITAKGTDIYQTAETRREILVLAAALRPGDSGGPLIDVRGRVVGLAFAIDPSEATTGYALSRAEMDTGLDTVLAAGASTEVDTGPCLVG